MQLRLQMLLIRQLGMITFKDRGLVFINIFPAEAGLGGLITISLYNVSIFKKIQGLLNKLYANDNEGLVDFRAQRILDTYYWE
jgi:hypothetical protein